PARHGSHSVARVGAVCRALWAGGTLFTRLGGPGPALSRPSGGAPGLLAAPVSADLAGADAVAADGGGPGPFAAGAAGAHAGAHAARVCRSARDAHSRDTTGPRPRRPPLERSRDAGPGKSSGAASRACPIPPTRDIPTGRHYRA